MFHLMNLLVHFREFALTAGWFIRWSVSGQLSIEWQDENAGDLFNEEAAARYG